MKSSEDERIAASGSSALVTWLARPTAGEDESRGGRVSMGRVFDGTALGPELKLDSSGFEDTLLSGAVPIVVEGALAGVGCVSSWPTGIVSCAMLPPGKKATSLFKVNSMNFGFKNAAIAAVSSGPDVLVFLPHGGVRMLSTRAGGPNRTHEGPQNGRDVEALAATLLSPDEAAVVYRKDGVIHGRRAGWDEKWRGPATPLSEMGMAVGAPAVANGPTPGSVLAWFAARKSTKEPWHVEIADWRADKVERSLLEAGGEQTQAPAVIAASDPRCLIASWVEGTGNATVTRIAPSCEGRVDRAKVGRLSREGVEGGRAALARSDTSTFAVWQEFPKGSASELRVARLTCR